MTGGPRCRCSGFRGRTTGTWYAHAPGQVGLRRHHCEQWVPSGDKDTEMRAVVRESFVRVSIGLVDMACVNGDVPPRLPVRSQHQSEALVLLAQRDELIRYIEELLEKDDPDVDRVWYYQRIQRMRYGTPTIEPQERQEG